MQNLQNTFIKGATSKTGIKVKDLFWKIVSVYVKGERKRSQTEDNVIFL